MSAKYLQAVARAFLHCKPFSDESLSTDGKTIRSYSRYNGGMILARWSDKGGKIIEVECTDRRFMATVNRQIVSLTELFEAEGWKVESRVSESEVDKGIALATQAKRQRKQP